MSKVFIVNPSNSSMGFALIVPRWLYVIAAGTPVELVGDPVVVDEPLERFNPQMVEPGDIVGIGIHTGNCLPGYRVLREAKARGAKVIVGGIHATIFPEEPLKMGADAVVTGNGDIIWDQVVKDALEDKLQRKYEGGRLPGEQLLKPRWDLLDPTKYMIGAIQTVAGCPENCSFCSVWVTEGRRPRQRMTDTIIQEAKELYQLGFRYVFFSDDNFNPSTLGRIAREPSEAKRIELERIREARLEFFEEYARAVPKNLYGFTQMTSEVISDDEYLSAMYHKMRIRGALIGIESFTQEGLKSVNKQWNPTGQRMVETIQKIQEQGIIVLSSIICGLETDTPESIRAMKQFARESGSALAQFPLYSPYPGTVDFHELLRDKKNRGQESYKEKHKIKLLYDEYWLERQHYELTVEHPNMTHEELEAEVHDCWKTFYSFRETLRRTTKGVAKTMPFSGKITFFFTCMVFKVVFRNGIAADTARQTKIGFFGKMAIRIAIFLSRRKSDSFGVKSKMPALTVAPTD